jgi:tetratricopeptide (TPR) repeat protein
MLMSPQRAAAVAVVAAGATSAGIDWTWEVPAAVGPVVVALALLSGPALGPKDDTDAEASGEETADPAWRRSLLPWGLATIAAGLIAVLLAATIFLSHRQVSASQAAADDGDLAEAGEEARTAIALTPWAMEPRRQLALVQESAGDLETAAATAAEASDRAPDDWQIWLVRARIATQRGQIDEAEADLAEARRLNPRAALFSSLRGPLPPAPPPNRPGAAAQSQGR